MSALVSRYNPDTILKIQPNDLGAYNQGSAISLPNYTLARVPSGMTYLLIDDTKHPIASQAVFKSIGYNPEEIVDVSDDDLASYNSSTFITTASVYPLGQIVKEKKSGNLYYIQNGTRQYISSMDIVNVNFPKKKVLTLDAKQLAKYPLDISPVTFKDGALIAQKGSAFIYVVSNGTRRLIPSETIFKNLGYQTKNIIYTNEQTLISVPEGAPIASDVTTVQRLAGASSN